MEIKWKSLIPGTWETSYKYTYMNAYLFVALHMVNVDHRTFVGGYGGKEELLTEVGSRKYIVTNKRASVLYIIILYSFVLCKHCIVFRRTAFLL